MENTINVALSRLVAQQRALDVTATNIANADTPGFRAARMLFTEWLQKEPADGAPRGARYVQFTQDRATWRDRQPGTLRHTANPLDIALRNPDAWLTVQTPRGPRLTRAGHYQLSATGQIVDEQGNALLDTAGRPLQTAQTDTRLSIAGDGALSSEAGPIGRIGVVQVADDTRLVAEGGCLFAASTPTRPATDPQLVQGAVEDSNVQPIVELNRMMNDLREFQFASQLIQGECDRLNGAIDKLTRKGG